MLFDCEENPYITRDFPEMPDIQNNPCILISIEGVYPLFVNENI